MAFKDKRIKEYVYDFSDTQVRSRAKSVDIDSLDYELGENRAIFGIQGNGGYYEVNILNIEKGNLDSTCDCPYDWGGICKHRVACLQLIDNIKSPTVTKKKTVKSGGKSILKVGNNPITVEFIQKNASAASISKVNQCQITVKEATPSQLILNGYVNDYYNSKNHIIIVTKNTDNLELICNCAARTTTLCYHKTAALFFIQDKISANYFNEKLFKKDCDAKIEKVGLPNGEKYVDVSIKANGLELTGKLEGITSLSTTKKWGDFTSEIVLESDKLVLPPIPEKRVNEVDYIIGLVIYHSNFSQFSVKMITGKPNKKGDIYAYLSEVDELSDLIVKDLLSDENTKIFSLAQPVSEYAIEHFKRKNSIYNTTENNEKFFNLLNYIHQHLHSLISSTKDIPFYKNDTPYDIKTQTISPINVSLEPIDIKFELTEEEDFFVLKSNLFLNSKEITAENILTELFLIIEKTYYLHKSVSHFKTLHFFKQNPTMRIVKDNFESFYKEIIVPLQKSYEVNININQKIMKKKMAESIVKKMYLSELEPFIMFKPFVAYPEKEVELLGKEPLLLTNGKDWEETPRNNELEEEFLEEVLSLHPDFEKQKERSMFYLKGNDFIKKGWFFDAFEKMKSLNIEVFGLEKLASFKYNPNKPVTTFNVKSDLDWFDVEMQLAFGDNIVSLKEIQKSILKKDNYIKLGDGTIGILPEEWLGKYESFFRNGEIKKDKLQISKFRFSIVDELFKDLELENDVYQEIEEKKRKLLQFESIESIPTPKGIKATLRDYQSHGLSWMNFLNEFGWGGCLADDMGLGKTIQVISLLKHLKDKKIKKANLVVVPTSLIFNWTEEINKFCKTLKVKTLTGLKRSKTIEDFDKFDVILIPYGTLTNDIEYLKEYTFNYVILDESQAIKNPTSKRYKTVRLLKSNNRIAMTGTPIENNTFDLYAQMTFLNPGMLGSIESFKKNYSNPIDKDKNKERAAELQKIITPFLLRRTKEQVATELPPKTESVLYCTMEKEQRKVYDAFRNKYRDFLMGKIEDDGIGKSKLYVLEGLMKLRQICDSPALLNEKEDYGNDSVKIKEIVQHISEKTGKHKILIFSQFVKMLALIKTELEKQEIKYEYLDGKTKNRQEKVESFQNDKDVRVFLISLKAGGTGLNLTEADYVYIVDPWWNPAVEAQAIDRCYRIGQTKKVMAYRMICKDTIEEKIIQHQLNKKQVASDIIQTEDSFVKSLGKDDIKALFS